MATIEYSVFRIKIVRPRQNPLFYDPNLIPRDLFLQAVQEKPAVKIRRNVWKVGNLEFFKERNFAGRFAVGTIKSSKLDVLDRDTGDFSEARVETTPYTYCLFDATIGLLGIAKKQVLAPYTTDIANRLKSILLNSNVVKRNELDVIIDPIRDPSPFLNRVKRAYRVSRYKATFTGPNPFDADEHFQKPLSAICHITSAKEGKVELNGDDLDRKVLQEISQSTVASGNIASASIRETKESKKITIKTEGGALKRNYEPSSKPFNILLDLIELYDKIRHSDLSNENPITRTTKSPSNQESTS